MKRKSVLKYVVAGSAIGMMVLMTGCSAVETASGSEAVELSTDMEIIEQTTEDDKQIQEVVEETLENATVDAGEMTIGEVVAEETGVESEEDTSQLTNEEWVDSLNVQRPTFIIFNEITGERQVLEDGQQYTFVEGDILALKSPKLWLPAGENKILYDSTEVKYKCIAYVNMLDYIDENTEFIQNVQDTSSGEVHSVTVYLSK